jgi:hypothetical protein
LYQQRKRSKTLEKQPIIQIPRKDRPIHEKPIKKSRSEKP